MLTKLSLLSRAALVAGAVALAVPALAQTSATGNSTTGASGTSTTAPAATGTGTATIPGKAAPHKKVAQASGKPHHGAAIRKHNAVTKSTGKTGSDTTGTTTPKP